MHKPARFVQKSRRLVMLYKRTAKVGQASPSVEAKNIACDTAERTCSSV